MEPRLITARKAITMGEDHTIEEYLDDLQGRIQVKLAREAPLLIPALFAWSAWRWPCAWLIPPACSY
jgi:hypothetical protein